MIALILLSSYAAFYFIFVFQLLRSVAYSTYRFVYFHVYRFVIFHDY